jgi:integrase
MQYVYGQRPFRYLEDKEVRRLIAKSPNPLVLEFVYWFGLRRGEVGLVRRSDVEPNGVWITALKRRKDFRQFMPLEGPLKFKVFEHLLSHQSEYLFPGYSGRGLSGNAVSAIWHKVSPCGVHILRHSRGQWFSDNGFPIEEASWWLRHSTLKSTECYYSISATRAAKIAKAMAR